MKYKLNFTEAETFIDTANAQSLLDPTAASFKTLLNPSNLQYFFEKYKQGDLNSL